MFSRRGGQCLGHGNWDDKRGGFSESCQLGKERKPAGSKTEVAGNDTLLGQIASFMENLHLSYDEVVRKIPYRNLVMMQRDKLHVVYGDKIEEVSARSMAGRKNIIRKRHGSTG